MTRVKSTQTISSADLRSLVRLALLLPAAFDLFLHHGGSCGLHSAVKNLGSFLPKVHAVSPDQRIHNNHLPRYEQNPIGVQSSEFESCGSPCYGANDSAIESRFEGPKENRRLDGSSTEEGQPVMLHVMHWGMLRFILHGMLQGGLGVMLHGVLCAETAARPLMCRGVLCCRHSGAAAHVLGCVVRRSRARA